MDDIQAKRKQNRNAYFNILKPLADKGYFYLPAIHEYATNNAHMFYIVCKSLEDRTRLIEHLKKNNINAVFHYLSLHNSEFYKNKHDGRELKNCDVFTDCLLRLPMYYGLGLSDTEVFAGTIGEFYENEDYNS